MTFESLVILGLATWRLSYLLSHEEGPFDLFGRLRRSLGAREAVRGVWTANSVSGKLILCPLCLSVWVSVLLYLLVTLVPPAWVIADVLAITGLACVVQLSLARH